MDRIKIPVKTGWLPYLVISLIFALLIFLGVDKSSWIPIAIVFFTLIFVAISFFSIRYEMDDKFLYIYSFFYLYKKVEIRRIYKIEKTWNLISSPAPSLTGRVEIYWPAYNSVVVSPKNFEDFKTELLKRNPDIEVKE
ncbi:PH domain-containing protein [Amniculibacterium sp. G2-70]|uniref:PH domain-containing protein n=1 Tax=Amniculibacterium sp. G2-70 TaxID=2767188 RepID=UPI0016540350|nr:PH domain-containing protein [Amniculibacterium sp. G2-70]